MKYSAKRLVEAARRDALVREAALELFAYAKAEELIWNQVDYCETTHGELRRKLDVPEYFKTIGDYLDDMRRKAIAKAEGKTFPSKRRGHNGNKSRNTARLEGIP